MTSLKLGGNTIKSEGMRILSDCLLVNTSVSELSLYDNLIEDEAIRYFASETLRVHTNLRQLTLGDNAMQPATLALLFENGTSLESLSLWDCRVLQPTNVGAALNAVDWLGKGRVPPRLHTLDLAGNYIDDAQLVQLLDWLTDSWPLQLTELDLSDNALSDAGLCAVARFIELPRGRVARLMLRGNTFADLTPLERAVLDNSELLLVRPSSPAIDRVLERNFSIQWQFVQPKLVDFTLAMFNLDLPSYVLLEIFDHLPDMRRVQQAKKIRTIVAVQTSMQRIRRDKQALPFRL